MEKRKLEKMAKYLPSARFLGLILGAAVIAVLFFFITSKFGSHSLFGKKGAVTVAPNGTIAGLVGQDSNHNGISDWEESLWGLDPTANGADNKRIIDQKKQAAGVPVSADDGTGANATDAFSQNLLSTILALQQSNSLTPEAVTNLATSIGDTVDAKHAEVPTWTEADMKIVNDTPANKAAYSKALKAAIDKYQSVQFGSELEIIANGLGSGDKESLKKLDPIAHAYTSFSKEVLAIPTPRAISSQSLVIANQTAIMGASLVQVEYFYDDILSGMVGLDDYKKASLLTDDASSNLSDYVNS